MGRRVRRRGIVGGQQPDRSCRSLEKRPGGGRESPPKRALFSGVVRERSLNAKRQGIYGQPLRQIENQSAIPLELEVVGEQGPEGIHQPGLAMELHGVALRRLGLPIDAHGAAALGLRGDVSRLSPLQCFLQRAHFFQLLGCGEDELSQSQQLLACRRRVRVEMHSDCWVGEGVMGNFESKGHEADSLRLK